VLVVGLALRHFLTLRPNRIKRAYDYFGITSKAKTIRSSSDSNGIV
jgi:hypothetical protein